MELGTPLWDFVLAAGVLTLGALLQAATGMGAGLMVVPLLALINLGFVPGPAVLAGMSLSLLMAWRGRRHIRVTGLAPLLAGLVPGAVLGSAAVAAIPGHRLGLIFGSLVLIAVIITATGVHLPLNRRNLAGAGAVSGFMGAVSGIGAPPLALLYQHQEGPTLRSTLAFVYTASSVLILGLLHLAGRFGLAELVHGLLLAPGYLVGYAIAAPLTRVLDGGYARAAILVISAASAMLLILRSL